jgi:RNAse (barnase) inhibitor barstar
MATFTGDPDETTRLDWRILQNGAMCLYFQRHILDEDVAWLGAQRYEVYHFDCGRWTSEPEFHADVSRQLGFPAWYGRNLDAFNDSLSDLVVPDQGGAALVLVRFDLFVQRLPNVAWHVLDIVDVNSRWFLLFGRRLVALVQSDDPSISINTVGARRVMWNPRELFDKQRSL